MVFGPAGNRRSLGSARPLLPPETTPKSGGASLPPYGMVNWAAKYLKPKCMFFHRLDCHRVYKGPRSTSDAGAHRDPVGSKTFLRRTRQTNQRPEKSNSGLAQDPGIPGYLVHPDRGCAQDLESPETRISRDAIAPLSWVQLDPGQPRGI
jgi:hypothetical protein